MAAAANFAWVNRSSMTFLVRQAFAKQFGADPDDLDMHVVYDVSHNIAKVGGSWCCRLFGRWFLLFMVCVFFGFWLVGVILVLFYVN
jgi:hypothetical protein